jgi:glycosyltransferase involved in cell wall biosynthesis
VVTLHNTTPHEDSRAFMATMRWIGRLAERCIVSSEHNARQARGLLGLAPERVRVIRPGAEPVRPGSAADRAAARRRLGLPADAPVAMFFGLIRHYKGVDVLVRAFARALARAPQAHLVVAGRPWIDWRPLERLIQELRIGPCVHAFPRYVPEAEVADFYRAADLVVLPYRGFDAQSAVGTSSLGYGRPMLVTRTGALPELVPDQWQVVPPGDVQALADRLGCCLGDLDRLARMRRAATEHARAFSWERTAEQTVALYRELCEERPPGPAQPT